MIISILGILKSGAAYVPIDPDYPQERIAYIEKDTNYRVLINEDELILFNLQRSKYKKDNLNKINSVSDLAYVIYTSGSTGEPKGVMVEQRNVIRLVKPSTFFPLDSDTILLSTGSISFDATIIEFFGTLLNGSKLILTSQNNLLDVHRLENSIKENKVNSLWMTASWFNNVVESNIKVFEHIKQLIIGGDIVSPTHVKKVFDCFENIKIVNGYGPTENTTFSTTFEIKNKSYNAIPIGKPVPNSKTYILDDNFQLLPIGVIGQMYVSGAGVARGYLNNQELTSKKFIGNPFVKTERLYDTGDLCRWLSDGNIEFLGRKDQQVKIRGFRIELGEIENTILLYSKDFNQVVVEARMLNNNKVLVAYFVSSSNIDKSELQNFLQKRLPDYMIPSFYIVLDEMPLTLNGKIDRKALPSISGENIIRNEYVEPRNEIEEKLVEIWREILGIEKIGVTDNFFELGGHSLNVIKLTNTIDKIFSVKLRISDILNNSNISAISTMIEELEKISKNKLRKSKIII
jgi:amino acid adenylation domain-containing protein